MAAGRGNGTKLKRGVALAAALGAALALAGLGASGASAALECTGNGIAAQGSSLQRVLQKEVWGPDFEANVCSKGSFPTITYSSTGSGAGMDAWDFDGSKGAIDTGVAFVGTDAPPDAGQIEDIAAGGSKLLTIPVAQTEKPRFDVLGAAQFAAGKMTWE